MPSWTLLLFTALAVASPIAKRNTGGVLVCTGPDATGLCNHAIYPLNTCINITGPYVEHADTFAPDGELFECYPYAQVCGGICTSPTGCTLGPVDFDYQHKYNMSAAGWPTMGSFKCRAKVGEDSED